MKFPSNPIGKPMYRQNQAKTQKQIGAYTGDPLFAKASYRCCPYCKDKQCKRNGIDTKGRIRRKCQCGHSFIVDWRIWNLDKLFSVVPVRGLSVPDRCVTDQYKYRIYKRILQDKVIQKFITNALIETDVDKSYSDNEKDEYIFIKACIMADDKDSLDASKHKDSWFFLLNQNNSDVSYVLENYAYRLIREHNVILSKRQPSHHGLLQCNKCGFGDISTHGFNNNGRRRIKCHNCQNISVINISHLISQDDLSYYCRKYLKEYTRDETLVNTVIQTLQNNFIYLSKSKEFNRLLARQAVITHGLKEQIIKSFIGTEIIRIKKETMQEYWISFFNILDLESYLNNQGYLNLKKGSLYGLYPKSITDLLRIDKVNSTEVYQLHPLEFEMAAHMHDENIFYDWGTRAQRAYQNVIKDL